MIELIFAIVIMGIVMMSAPNLIRISSKSNYVALLQESVAAAATQINMILSAAWDANDANTTVGEPVLTTVSSIFGQCTGGAAFPVGVTDNLGRYCLPLGGPNVTYPASTVLGPEGTEGSYFDDIDDFNNQSYTVQVYNAESYEAYEGDYIDTNITVSSRIYYGDDVPRNAAGVRGNYGLSTTFSNPFDDTNASASTTNIKLVTVRLTSANPVSELADKEIRLSAFACNLGAPKSIYSAVKP